MRVRQSAPSRAPSADGPGGSGLLGRRRAKGQAESVDVIEQVSH